MSGAGGLFWAGDEARLRTPWRIGATASLALLAAIVVAAVARPIMDLDGPASGAWDLAILAGAFLALSGAVVAIGWVVDRRHVRDLGLGFGRTWWLDAGAGAVVGAAMATAAVAVLLAADAASVAGGVTGREARLTVTGVGPLAGTVLWGLFYLGTATLEEVLVRGYLLVNAAEGLAGRLGRSGAVLAAVAGTAGLFGFLHAANPGGTTLGLVNLCLAGVLLGGAYALTGRLALPIGIHAAWNVAAGAVYGLPVSGLETSTALLAVETRGSALVTGGRFGPEGGLVMLAALAVGGGLVAAWVRWREGTLHLQAHIAEPDLREPPARDDGAEEAADADGEAGATTDGEGGVDAAEDAAEGDG